MSRWEVGPPSSMAEQDDVPQALNTAATKKVCLDYTQEELDRACDQRYRRLSTQHTTALLLARLPAEQRAATLRRCSSSSESQG